MKSVWLQNGKIYIFTSLLICFVITNCYGSKNQTTLPTFVHILLNNEKKHITIPSDFNISLDVTFEADIGQNYGTLFEIFDEQGQVLAGAGYLGVNSTRLRSNRRLLHFYINNSSVNKQNLVDKSNKLPRFNDGTSTYLYEFDNILFARSNNSPDTQPRMWDRTNKSWKLANTESIFERTYIGNGVLSWNSTDIFFDGQPIIQNLPANSQISNVYYANGFLFFRLKESETENILLACQWLESQPNAIDIGTCFPQNLITFTEYMYAYGQLPGLTIATSNTGGIYEFNGINWSTLLPPILGSSFQIYTILNFHDKLLMGQYPSGELFEYDGVTIKRLYGAPPVMPEVSNRAREAQTLTIYGGDIYVGIWPWGEIWRMDRQGNWHLEGRMFNHPNPSSPPIHPYENEMLLFPLLALNSWGQRITSMVPQGDSLFISTGSKGGIAFEPSFSFLNNDKWKDYGQVYQYKRNANLAVSTEWVNNGQSTFTFELKDKKMRVLQDNILLGELQLNYNTTEEIVEQEKSLEEIVLGDGVFGKFRGIIQNK